MAGVCSLLVGITAPAVVGAGDCVVPNVPGRGGICNVICPASGTAIDAEVEARGIDVFAKLRCPVTSDATVFCEGDGVLEDPADVGVPVPGAPAGVGILGLGCRAFTRGAFTGVCQCSASGGLVTSARCSCE